MSKKKLLVILFFLLFYNNIYSQKSELYIQGKPEKISSEIVGIRDLNGRYCAAIKIISSLEGLKYKSYNGVVKVEDDPGQDLVYVSANERVLEIYHTSYAPTKIILSEVGIRLKEKEVWEIHLVGDKKVPIYIITNPENAKIYIDNNNVDGNGTIQTTLGKHILQIKMNGFRTIEQNLIVKENMAPLKFQLEEIELAQVQIKSNPTGAEFTINGTNKGITDQGLWLFPQNYPIEIKLSGHKTILDTIIVVEGELNSFDFKLEKSSKYGLLNITTDPIDVELSINKEKYKKTKNISLGEGSYKVEISKNGYQTISEWIQIAQDKTLNKSYTLKMMRGDLRFNITPLDASVQMTREGKLIEEWKGMKQISNLPIGDYYFVCHASGFEEIIKEEKIEENEILDLNIKLNKNNSGPIFSWVKRHKVVTAIIGTGLTAGGAAIYYMSQNGDSGENPLPGIDDIWPPR